jgi:ribosome biogenesis GTPase
MPRKNRKIRADFRKNRAPRTRRTDWTRHFQQDRFADDGLPQVERIGKGELTRRRTVVGSAAGGPEEAAFDVHLDVDETACLAGRVLAVFGLTCRVQGDDGRVYQCVTRRLLRTLATEQRHVVAAGDRVRFRPVESGGQSEGIIERIEPRRTCLARAVRGRQHVIVANVDQVLIVASAAEPRLKPNLIDRLLVSSEQARLRPVLCINKIDLVDPASLEPLVGVYCRMGYEVLLLSATAGLGIDRFRRVLANRQNVVAGQSGVGKSTLLNAAEPGLRLPIAPVSAETEKGRHTTSTARLLPLSFGGYVVDTPGMRQFQLWDVIREEVINFYRDLRPYVSCCKFPNCTHTHEADCAVKNAVADGRLDARRYESYLHLRGGDAD